MSKVIDRIGAKITRAKQHIQDFQLGLDAFYKTKPYQVAFDEQTEPGKRIYYVAKVDCVPDTLTAIAADVIQNLRSPLDHIAYQLVLDACHGTKPDWPVYYPISRSATDYPGNRRGRIKGVRDEVINAIDATEPYEGGKGHALWQLNELSKPDKHELLIGALVDSGGVDMSFIARDMFMKRFNRDVAVPSMFIREIGPLTSMNVGDKVYIEPVGHKMHQDRKWPFYIALDVPGVIKREPAIKTLQDMTDLVDNIITTLGKLLP